MGLQDRFQAAGSDNVAEAVDVLTAAGQADKARGRMRVRWVFAAAALLVLAGFLVQLRLCLSFGLLTEIEGPAVAMGLVTLTGCIGMAEAGYPLFCRRGLAWALATGGGTVMLAWALGVTGAALVLPQLFPGSQELFLLAVVTTGAVPVLLVGLLGGFVARLLLLTLPAIHDNS